MKWQNPFPGYSAGLRSDKKIVEALESQGLKGNTESHLTSQ